jgi:hypothetical protein|tara:strand:- start:3364 stop:3573 length:210 start_codon:yes stop_codon:yes gene_type:complete
MNMWILVETEVGPTRINTNAICAYQKPKEQPNNGESLLIYTSDNTLFDVNKNCENIIQILDNHFDISNL